MAVIQRSFFFSKASQRQYGRKTMTSYPCTLAGLELGTWYDPLSTLQGGPLLVVNGVRKIYKWPFLGGGFNYFLFSPLFGEDSHFDDHIFQMGWFNHQAENLRNTLTKSFRHFLGVFGTEIEFGSWVMQRGEKWAPEKNGRK